MSHAWAWRRDAQRLAQALEAIALILLGLRLRERGHLRLLELALAAQLIDLVLRQRLQRAARSTAAVGAPPMRAALTNLWCSGRGSIPNRAAHVRPGRRYVNSDEGGAPAKKASASKASVAATAPPAASSSNVFSSASRAAAGTEGACQGHRKPGAGRVAAGIPEALADVFQELARVSGHDTARAPAVRVSSCLVGKRAGHVPQRRHARLR